MLKGLVKMSCGENPPGAGDGRVFKPRSAKTSCEAFLQAGINLVVILPVRAVSDAPETILRFPRPQPWLGNLSRVGFAPAFATTRRPRIVREPWSRCLGAGTLGPEGNGRAGASTPRLANNSRS